MSLSVDIGPLCCCVIYCIFAYIFFLILCGYEQYACSFKNKMLWEKNSYLFVLFSICISPASPPKILFALEDLRLRILNFCLLILIILLLEQTL